MTRLSLSFAGIWPTTAMRREQPLRFNLRELSGSLGDLGTFLPLSTAMALICGMDIGLIFIFAGLMNITTGIWFRQPVPVQPMKAIAAVAIAESLGAGAIASAGMITGLAVMVLTFGGGVDWVARTIPKPVVRGIQAGVGVKLAWKGFQWLGALPVFAWDSWLIAAVVGLAAALWVSRQQPVLLYVFIAGFVLVGFQQKDVSPVQSFTWPRFHFVMPTPDEWWTGLTRGALAQLPLTLLNSVIAVCALSHDYFPGRGIPPRRMAASVGLMNLCCVPLGGMPMCHGAGGLAAQYRFGARTGGSVVMLGTMKIVVGLLLGGTLLATLRHYPVSILAIMVISAGFTLARAAKDCMSGRSRIIVVAMVVGIVTCSTLAGFLLGCLLTAALHRLDQWRAISP